VPAELFHFGHVRVAPQDELILAKPMARHKFFVVRRPKKGADLASCVHAVHKLPCVQVPKFDGSVRSPPSTCQKASLERGPRESFHGRLMLSESKARCDFARGRERTLARSAHAHIPDAEEVFIPSRRQSAAISTPLQTTNFLSMTSKSRYLGFGSTDI
jgi:hypothetical protein